MNVLDLFSGIGGFSLGLERAGMRTVAFCEIDPYCRRVLAERWPGIEIHEDIATRGFVRGEADVITAGFPCQDVSFAGDGAGLTGERSGLYRHVIRAIRLVRPRVAVLENVAALLNRGLDEVIGDLAEIGYDAEWHCIPACAVGAPHRRDRIWIVAIPFGDGQQGSSPGGEAERADGAQARGQAGGVPITPSITDAICREFAQRGQIGRMGRQESISWDGAWEITSEPFVRRGDHGISNRAHRLRTLGNAVVPQIPEIIGRAIMNSTYTTG
jgi:DNA (cytosine-5)-methyltransferase 1